MIKSHYGFKMYLYPNILIPLANWTIYVSMCSKKKFVFLNLMQKKKRRRGKLFLPPSTFQNEVILVKFELQTHMEHLSSCRSRGLVIFVLLSFLCYCIRNFLSAIKYLSFCFVIPVYLYHILLMK
jgi:hypothetical protein